MLWVKYIYPVYFKIWKEHSCWTSDWWFTNDKLDLILCGPRVSPQQKQHKTPLWDRQLKWYGHYVNDETQEIWWLCWESNWLTTISDLKAQELDLFEMFEEQTSKHLLPMMAISFEQHSQKHLRKKTSQIVMTFLMNDTSKNSQKLYDITNHPTTETSKDTLVGGLNPFEKYARQIGSFPQSRGKN